ncbi:LysR family transcriptional regulator [Lachnospiraceae bacterium 62-35]
MTLQQMKYLIMLEQEKKITQAAEKCFISQSAFSQQLRKIEQEVGERLFFRQNNIWFPTEAGKILLEGFGRILDIYDISIRQMKELSRHVPEEICLTMPSSRAAFVFADIYSVFKREYPACALKLMEAPFVDVPRLVSSGLADMGLFVSKGFLAADISEKLQYYPLYTEPFVIIARKEHPLARKASLADGKLDMEYLNSEKLIMYGKNLFLRQTIDSFFERYHVMPQEIISFDSTTTCIQFVRNGFGCAIIPEMLSHGVTDLVICSLNPAIAWELGIIFRRQRPMTRAELLILEQLKLHMPVY